MVTHKFTFAFRGGALLADTDRRGAAEVTDGYRAAAIWIGPHIDINSDKIAALSTWFTASSILLAAEGILWTISLAR